MDLALLRGRPCARGSLSVCAAGNRGCDKGWELPLGPLSRLAKAVVSGTATALVFPGRTFPLLARRGGGQSRAEPHRSRPRGRSGGPEPRCIPTRPCSDSD